MLDNKRSLYNIYRIRKPNGKFRVIHAPCAELKAKQKELADRLSEGYTVPDYVHGFIPGKSAASLAANHTGKDWVITIDIKDFFPTITDKMITSIGLSEEEADIATLDGHLIQGSPCSPVISNFIFRKLDILFASVFHRDNIRYDRYADDLVLSGMGSPTQGHVNWIREMCKLEGFTINEKKIKFMFKNQEQKVLGITVNSGVSINHKTRKALKNKIKYEGKTDKEVGYLAYVNSVNKQQCNRLKSSI